MSNPVTIYVHIPKTGGQSFYSILDRNYQKERIFSSMQLHKGLEELSELSSGESEKLDLIRGHLPYGIHEIVERDATYITILRNPVDRLISLYHHIKRSTNHFFYEQINSGEMGLEQFAESGEFFTDNAQTRFLYGRDGHLLPKIEESHYQVALDNLENMVQFVGLTESFDLSILLFQKQLGWKTPYYHKVNVATKKYKSKAQIPEHVVATIREHNKYDILLYDKAQELFSRQLESYLPSVDRDLGFFRAKNRAYNLLSRMKRALRP